MAPAPTRDATARPSDFPFHPWVARACRRALVWGLGVLALLATVAGWLQGGATGWAWGRAFGVLLAYSLVFWLTLFKIWWTARGTAVWVEAEALAYQPLYGFRPRRVPWRSLLAVSPRPGTHSLRLVVERRGTARELFLNLAVILGRRPFLAALGAQLEAAGFEPLAGRADAWVRPGWEEPETAAAGGRAGDT